MKELSCCRSAWMRITIQAGNVGHITDFLATQTEL